MDRIKICYSNLRFDNKRELSNTLQYFGYKDSELTEDKNFLIRLYHKYLSKTPSYLVGDFAFSILDKERGYYFCARDQLGHASFYYTFRNGFFLSDSSLTKLLKLLPDKPKFNINSMKEFAWNHGNVNPQHTMYEGVYRLPPGHQMIVKDGKTEVSRYWDPKSIKINYDITEEKAAERFLEIFKEAVMCRLDKGNTTACELSGGLDSSSVFCVASEHQANIEAYSMRFNSMSCDEGSYIDSIMNHTERVGIEIPVGDIDYKEKYNLNSNYTISPHWPLKITFTFFLPMMEAMQKKGIKTVLTGQGGDHLLTGSILLPFDHLRRFRFRLFIKEYKGLGTMKKLAIRKLMKRLLYPVIPPDFIFWFRRLLHSYETPPLKGHQEYTSIYHANTFTQKEYISVVTSANYFMFADSSVYSAAKEYLGIEFRHPFFDLRVVEFLLSLPSEFKYSNGSTKRLLRNAMKDILPESVRTRQTKATFNETLMQQMKAIDLDNFWEKSNLVRLGIIKQKTLDLHNGCVPNTYTERYRHCISREDRSVLFWNHQSEEKPS